MIQFNKLTTVRNIYISYARGKIAIDLVWYMYINSFFSMKFLQNGIIARSKTSEHDFDDYSIQNNELLRILIKHLVDIKVRQDFKRNYVGKYKLFLFLLITSDWVTS